MSSWSSEGLSLWGAVFGSLMSSTRTEIAAGLLAVSAPGSVHLASDSFNFVKMSTSIVAKEDFAPPKPWALYPNGDL